MSSSRQRRLRRERQQIERRRATREHSANETQQQQAMAAARQDATRRRRRHFTAYAMYAVAAVIAIGHFFEHNGTFTPMSPAMMDLFLGWPMALVIALGGAVVYGT